ncbi:MAG TPA: class I SAM-dependent methyltransferase [Gemmatimonadales bacterium]|nr:class I SAM-dependent methyltransferase [Gemmatimonadales bacterium]
MTPPVAPPGPAQPRELTSRGTHAVVARLLAAEPQCRTVLDIPCGEGAFLARLGAMGLTGHGADLVDRLVLPGARFTAADMNAALPFAAGAFDAVVCIDGIEHLERPFDFVRECRRVVRPGGVLIISTPNISALRSRWRWLLTGFHNKGKVPLNERDPNPWHHLNLLSFPALRYLLQRHDFRITAVAANRIKVVSWLYLPLWPVAAVATALAFRRWERDRGQRRRNAEIRRQMLTAAIAFGETMIVKAVRAAPTARA